MANFLIIPSKIHLNRINWVKKNTFLLPEKLDKNPIYDIKMAHNMMHNLEKELIKIRLFLELNANINGKEINQGGNYEIDFFFKIDDLKEHFELKTEKPIFNGQFVCTLLAISYSTMRGMLFSIWQNTFLELVILPVIDVPELLQNKKMIK